ncbi:hypothetical protein [Cupriavidus campinensis]
MITNTIMAMVRAIAGMRTEPLALPDRVAGRLARWRSHGPRLWAALWLVLCLLLAQHAGLTHRVVHGGLPDAPAAAAVGNADAAGNADPFTLKAGLHSCVLFDGATMADSHHGTFDLPVLAFGKPVKPASLAWRWPDLPAARLFLSRAPPASPVFA